MINPISRLTGVALFFMSAQSPAFGEEHDLIFVLPQGFSVSDTVNARGRMNPALMERDAPIARQLSDIARAPAVDDVLQPGMAAELAERLTAFRQRSLGPVTGIATFTNGQRVFITQQSGVTVVTPGGGDVGGIPAMDARSLDRAPVLASLTLGGENIAIPNLGRPVGDCGVNTSDPTTHCALSTVPLYLERVGLFCSGVVVTDHHVLTAAHCLCDKTDGVTLAPEVFVSFGAEPFTVSMRFEPRLEFLDVGAGTYCDALAAGALGSGNNDLAVLTLSHPDPASGTSPLEHVEDQILMQGLEENVTLDPDAVSRLRSLVGQAGPQVWAQQRAPSNTFATWGFGRGPDHIAGTKRAMEYSFERLLACQGSVVEEECQGLQDAVFHNPVQGLCKGDSGGGVFKPADEDIPDGYGEWALMGIISGTSHISNCFDHGTLLGAQRPRNIVRVDTAEVATWLDAVTEDAIRRSQVRLSYDAQLVRR